MTVERDPDAILTAWLEEGPTVLPEPTRRAIAVSTRNVHRSRLPTWLPWRDPNMNGMSRLALAAVAIVAVVVGGLVVLRPGADQPGGVGGPGSPVPSVSAAPSPSALPSASAPPSAAAIPEPSVGALTQAFTSPSSATRSGTRPAGSSRRRPRMDRHQAAQTTFVSAAGGWFLRALSRPVPDGVVVDDWILQTLQQSDDPGCMPRRDTMEPVTVDGHEGRILGFCGVPPAPQIEATFVVDKRAYLFTLFDGQPAPTEQEARALFDRLMTTITLDPASAVSSPKPSPS